MLPQLLTNNDIDIDKYDESIRKSLNTTVFAYSWYLNIVCPDWCALVYDNYNIVMPLTKVSVCAVDLPPFVLWTGIFSDHLLSESESEMFFNSIPSDFKSVKINLNKFNYYKQNSKFLKIKSVFQFDLIVNADIRGLERSPFVKNIFNECESLKLKCIQSQTVEIFFNFIARQTVCKTDYVLKLMSLIRKAIFRDCCLPFLVLDAESQPVAAAAVIYSDMSVYIPVISYAASSNIINHSALMILDTVLKTFSERDMILYIDALMSNIDVRLLTGSGAGQFSFLSFAK